MVPAKAGKPFGPNVGLVAFLPGSRCESGYRLPGRGPSGSGSLAGVGAPVWPSGATEAALATVTPTADAASAAVPAKILRRSMPPREVWGSGLVSEVVMVSSHSFLLGAKHRPAFRHLAGGQPQMV